MSKKRVFSGRACAQEGDQLSLSSASAGCHSRMIILVQALARCAAQRYIAEHEPESARDLS